MEDGAINARRYMAMFGTGALARLEADVSRAIGRTDWAEYMRLQQVKLRLVRLQMHAGTESRVGRLLRMAGITPSGPRLAGNRVGFPQR